MKRIINVAAAAYGLASLALAVSPAPAAAQQQVTIVYEEPKTAALRPFYQKLKKMQVLETLQKFLSPAKFPLTVKTAECGGLYATYQPGAPATICYEFVNLIESVLPGEQTTLKSPDKSIPDLFGDLGRIGPVLVTRGMASAGPFVEQALHEVAIAVFDKLELPVWGKREDAADYLAAFIMLQFGTDVARKTIYGTAYFLNEVDKVDRASLLKDENYLGDVRPTLRQRYYNILCIAVGRDPIGFSSFIAIGRTETIMDLPANRAVNCRGGGMDSDRPGNWSIYERVRQAFSDLVLPEVDQKLLKEVQNTKWLPDEE